MPLKNTLQLHYNLSIFLLHSLQFCLRYVSVESLDRDQASISPLFFLKFIWHILTSS